MWEREDARSLVQRRCVLHARQQANQLLDPRQLLLLHHLQVVTRLLPNPPVVEEKEEGVVHLDEGSKHGEGGGPPRGKVSDEGEVELGVERRSSGAESLSVFAEQLFPLPRPSDTLPNGTDSPNEISCLVALAQGAQNELVEGPVDQAVSERCRLIVSLLVGPLALDRVADRAFKFPLDRLGSLYDVAGAVSLIGEEGSEEGASPLHAVRQRGCDGANRGLRGHGNGTRTRECSSRSGERKW